MACKLAYFAKYVFTGFIGGEAQMGWHNWGDNYFQDGAGYHRFGGLPAMCHFFQDAFAVEDSWLTPEAWCPARAGPCPVLV